MHLAVLKTACPFLFIVLIETSSGRNGILCVEVSVCVCVCVCVRACQQLCEAELLHKMFCTQLVLNFLCSLCRHYHREQSPNLQLKWLKMHTRTHTHTQQLTNLLLLLTCVITVCIWR